MTSTTKRNKAMTVKDYTRTITEDLNRAAVHADYVAVVCGEVRVGISSCVEYGKDWFSFVMNTTNTILKKNAQGLRDNHDRPLFGKVEHDRAKKYETYGGLVKYITEFRIELLCK